MLSLRHLLEPIDGIERRAQRRYPIKSDVAFKVLADDEEYDCIVEDVSLGGLRLRLAEAVEPGTEVHFTHPFLGRFSAVSRWSEDSLVGFVIGSQESSVRICVHCLKQLVPSENTA